MPNWRDGKLDPAKSATPCISTQKQWSTHSAQRHRSYSTLPTMLQFTILCYIALGLHHRDRRFGPGVSKDVCTELGHAGFDRAIHQNGRPHRRCGTREAVPLGFPDLYPTTPTSCGIRFSSPILCLHSATCPLHTLQKTPSFTKEHQQAKYGRSQQIGRWLHLPAVSRPRINVAGTCCFTQGEHCVTFRVTIFCDSLR